MADSSDTQLLPPEPTPRKCRLAGSSRHEISLVLKTITPILGGSPTLRQVDRHELIRVPGIRGSLRFWWRALYGGRYEGPKELAKAEAEIFGGAGDDKGRRSTIDLSLSLVKPNDYKPEEIVLYSDSTKIEMSGRDAYALWPAREMKKENRPTAPRLKPGIVFSLQVRVPSIFEEQMLCTLRAWLLFGGYGSRTRRGCGSLGYAGGDSSSWLPKELTKGEFSRLFPNITLFGNYPQPKEMPLLHGASLWFEPKERDALQAWYDAIAWLQSFRQSVGVAREPGANPRRPGRSYWPEPDKIRHLMMGQRLCAHPPRPVYGKNPVYPRAGFGLPILGQFQRLDRYEQPYARGDNPRYEPDDFELVWREKKQDGTIHERLASPLILKPMALASGHYVPIALWLSRLYPPHGHIVLRPQRQKQRIVPESAADFDALTARNEGSAFEPLRGKKSMRQAFGDWLKTSKQLKELA